MNKNKIKEVRQRRGWTQLDLARASGLWPSDISRIESGRMIPYPKHAVALASALGLSAKDLISPPTPEGGDNERARP